jgi:hypothetical protein
MNYALGVTRIRFLAYLLTTAICMAPPAFAFTWLGYAGREAAVGGEGLVRKVLIALALLAALAFLPRLVRRWHQAPAAIGEEDIGSPEDWGPGDDQRGPDGRTSRSEERLPEA